MSSIWNSRGKALLLFFHSSVWRIVSAFSISYSSNFFRQSTRNLYFENNFYYFIHGIWTYLQSIFIQQIIIIHLISLQHLVLLIHTDNNYFNKAQLLKSYCQINCLFFSLKSFPLIFNNIWFIRIQHFKTFCQCKYSSISILAKILINFCFKWFSSQYSKLKNYFNKQRL